MPPDALRRVALQARSDGVQGPAHPGPDGFDVIATLTPNGDALSDALAAHRGAHALTRPTRGEGVTDVAGARSSQPGGEIIQDA
jgi:hypothetical protein